MLGPLPLDPLAPPLFAGGATAGFELASLGFDPFAISSTSVTPSLSSSRSVTSGSPSLSVSL